MRYKIQAYRWICDDCGVEVVSLEAGWQYPEGWDEVDDNEEGECQDICEKCLPNHCII